MYTVRLERRFSTAIHPRSKLLERHVGASTRCGSSAASRRPARFGPEGSRAEPLLRGSFREKVDYSNLNRRPARMPVCGAGPRRNRGHDSGLYAPQPPATPIAPLQVAILHPEVPRKDPMPKKNSSTRSKKYDHPQDISPGPKTPVTVKTPKHPKKSEKR